jgi:hypothetical protein
MTDIAVWFVESGVEDDLFAVDPAKKDSPNVNATRCHYEALVFASQADAQAWCDAQPPEPPWHPMVYTFSTGAVH